MTEVPPEGRPLAPRDLAAMIGVDPKTVSRLAAAGRIASFRTMGGHRRFHRAEAERFAAAYHPEGEWVTIAGLAAALRVDGGTAVRWARGGKLPGAVKDGTGHWLIPRATLDAMTGGTAP